MTLEQQLAGRRAELLALGPRLTDRHRELVDEIVELQRRQFDRWPDIAEIEADNYRELQRRIAERAPCWQTVCRGEELCSGLRCSQAVLDELLWELFGWLWRLGGRTDLETWFPDETRVAGLDEGGDWQGGMR